MNALLKVICLAFAGLALSSCAVSLSGGVVDNLIENRAYIADSAVRPLTVADTRGTFLMKSSRIFYPRGIPGDPGLIPDLTEAELTGIEHMLEVELTRVTATQSQHRGLLVAQFPGFDDRRARVHLEIKNQRLAFAATEQSGRMFVDAKVIQAIYRAALLSILVGENFVGTKEERERLAFAKFAQFSQQLEGMSPVLPVSDARGFAKRAWQAKGTLLDRIENGLDGLLAARLHDMALVEQSQSLERSFLGAIDFLLSHETAHLVLGHFPLATDCEDARARELVADQYAVLLVGLARFDRLPLTMKQASNGWINLFGISAAIPDGYEPFFRFAYGLAGFDSVMGSVPECSYPPSDEREKALAPFASMIDGVMWEAKWDYAFGSLRQGVPVPTATEALYNHYYSEQLSTHSRVSGKNAPRKPTADDIRRNCDLLHALFDLYYRQ